MWKTPSAAPSRIWLGEKWVGALVEAVGGFFVQDPLFHAVSTWKLQVGAPEAFAVLLTPHKNGVS